MSELNPFDVVDLKEQKEQHDKSIRMKNHICHDKIRNIPDEMKAIGSWMWSNHKKSPCDSKGFSASSKDKENHMTFEDMVNKNTNKYYYSFRLNNDFLVIDLDEAIDKDGELRPFAKEVIELVKDNTPYIERSLSGRGLHVILANTKSWNDTKPLSIKLRKKHEKYSDLPFKAGIDIFNCRHPIILTGDIYEGHSPKKLGKTNNELKKFHKSLVDLNLKDKSQSKLRLEKKKINGSVDKEDIFSIIDSQVSMESVLDKYDIKHTPGSLICCPFPDHHDKTASMMVYNYSNSYNCFGCNKGGDVVSFVANMEDIRQIDAAKKLDEMFDLEIDFEVYNNVLEEEWIIEVDDKIDVDLNSLRNHLYEEHNIYFTEHLVYMYEEGSYKVQNVNVINKLIEMHMPGVYNNKFKHSRYIDEVYKQLARNYISYNEFNKDKFVANFKNQRLVFKLGSDKVQQVEHSPEFMETFQIMGNYTEGLKCQIWDNFIRETLPKDQITLLQEIMGYALINNNMAKKFFGFYGKKDTGKSLTLDVLTRIIGNEHVSAVPLQELADTNNKFASINLYDKLLNVCGDLSDGIIKDTALIKSLTSGNDKIKFERKGKDGFSGYNTARMYFSFNKLPAVKNKCKAFFERFIIIPFNNVVAPENINPELIDMFDLDGVISWCIEGLRRLLKNKMKFSISETNIELTKYYTELDSPVMDFVNTNIEVTNNMDDSILQKDLMEGFKIFCKYFINNEWAAKMKLSKLLEEINNNFEFKFSKNIYNPDTKKSSLRGFKGIKFTDEFLEEIKKYSLTY